MGILAHVSRVRQLNTPTLTWVLISLALFAVPTALYPRSPEASDFIGAWHLHTNLSDGEVTIRGDGTFEYRRPSNPNTLTGRWRLEAGAIVWTYSLPPGVELKGVSNPDVNPIVELTADRIVIRESDHSLSVLTRNQPRNASLDLPATPPPSGVWDRFAGAGVAAALTALVAVLWRVLRPRVPKAAPPGADTLYPCLKETAWARLGPTLRRPLWQGESSDWMPWLAFGYESPDAFQFLSDAEAQETGRSAAELEAEAIANLCERSDSWQMVELGLKGVGHVQMATCTDDFLAAERILDVEAVLEAQRRLGARELLAGVPRRGLLTLIDADADAAAIAWFVMMVADEHFGGESAAITPLVFRISKGRIVGLLSPGPPARPPAEAAH